MVTVVPTETVLFTATVPSWSSMTLRALVSPRPVPRLLVVKNGSKID